MVFRIRQKSNLYCRKCHRRLKGNGKYCYKCRLEIEKEKNKERRLKKELSPKNLKAKCDKVWSKTILLKGKCEVCGRKFSLNAHHIVGRRNLTLRFDLRNGCCLCSGCHRLYKNSAHENPIWFIQWTMQNRPADYNYLFEKQEELTTFIDYKEILKKLEEEYAILVQKINK